MDQIAIGKFIAAERKRNGFPEISLLLPLCNELDITVNELLSGERISEEDYRKKAEENMVNLVKEAQESRKKIVLSAMVAIACILDREAGAFECPECKERFVPEMNAYIMGPHTITKRKLKCPKCGAHKYCKKVLTR